MNNLNPLFRQIKKSDKPFYRMVGKKNIHNAQWYKFKMAKLNKSNALKVAGVLVIFVFVVGSGVSALVLRNIEAKNVPAETPRNIYTRRPTNPVAVQPCTPSDTYYVNMPGSELQVLNDNRDNATVISRLPDKTQVTAGCLDGAWMKIIHGTDIGFTKASSLSKSLPVSNPEQPANSHSTKTTSSQKTSANTSSPQKQALAVSSVTVDVNPTSSSISPILGCSQDFTFTATINSTGTGQMVYQWERSDGVSATGSTTVSANGQRLQYVWTVGQTSSGTLHLRITSPSQVVSNDVGFSFIKTCL